MTDILKTIYRCIYKYSVAVRNSIILFFRSFTILPFLSWVHFWTPGVSFHKTVHVNSLQYQIHGNSFPQRIADLFMIITCIVDRQYNPPGFEIEKTDTIIDIGGHIGSFSIFAAQEASQGHVYTFEPDPHNFACLHKNIEMNNFPNITAASVVVAEKTGTVLFYPSVFNTAESGIYRTFANTAPITIPSITLSDLFQKYNIAACDFLKIDCEGAEYEILYRTPAECLQNIKKIAMECHAPPFFGIENPAYTQRAMISFLQNHGFAVTEKKENAIHSLLFAQRNTSINQTNENRQ